MLDSSNRIPKFATILLVLLLFSCGGGGNGDGGSNNTSGGNTGGGAPVSNGITGGEVLTPASGDPASSEGGTIGIIRDRLSDSDFTHQFSAPLNRQAISSDTIAYVATINGSLPKTIRLIQADGSQDRELFSLPTDASANSFVSGLVWRPDGTELALYSNFEVSVWDWDIYALTAIGDNLRRLTNVPRPIAYPNLPQGRTELTAHNTRPEGRVIAAYVEGSQQAAAWTAPGLTQRTIGFSVADFGPGIAQVSVVGSDLNACYFDLAANVDVVADNTQAIPQILPDPSQMGRDEECPKAFIPQWGSKGNLYFIRHTRANVVDNSLDHVYSVMRTISDNIAPSTRGERLFAFGEGTNPNSFGGDIVKHISAFRIDPTDNSDEVLIAGEVNSFSPFSDRIWLTNLSNPQTFTQISVVMPNCGNGISLPRCTVNDVQWLPDGNGFIYSLALAPASSSSAPPSGQLRLSTIANGVLVDRLLIDVPNDKLGDFSIAPDAQQLVIERQGDQIGSTDLYIYNIANNNFSLLIKGAASPAWSP